MQGEETFMFCCTSIRALEPFQPSIIWVLGPFLPGGGGGKNRQRRDAGQLRPSSTIVMWSYTSTPHICLHGMER